MTYKKPTLIMREQRPERQIIQNLMITDASEDRAIAKHNGMVIFMPFGAPGDTVDAEVIRKKKNYADAKIIKIVSPSPFRIEPFCEHFGVCGGCKWQHLKYQQQLSIKQKHIRDNLQRIAKIEDLDMLPIISSEKTKFYRNKLEYTFSDKKWLTEEEIKSNQNFDGAKALGFHIPGRFDKILQIKNCYLQPAPSNDIRLKIEQFVLEQNWDFSNLHTKTGFLRNLIIRNNEKGEFMIILVVTEHNKEKPVKFASFVMNEFPSVISVYAAINNKFNDSLENVEVIKIEGAEYLEETLCGLKFQIAPLSFFQTNIKQSEKLYEAAIEMINFTGKEIVYDLYTGTGTIAALLSSKVKQVVGIEYVKSAIDDGNNNLANNNINNVTLVHGDMSKILNFSFAKKYGFPDIIFTDPPRAGMHPNVIKQIICLKPKEIVYISCNPATQARDVFDLKDFYDVNKIQPVDMFPQTHHVENIVHLVKKQVNRENKVNR